MERIKLYRYEGSTHYKGACYPNYDKRCTEWSDNFEEQKQLYNSAKAEHFEANIDEMKFNNDLKTNRENYVFFWCMLHSIEVPMEDWKKAKRSEDYEMLPYLVDFEYKEIAERGIYPDGRNMGKRIFESIVYEPHKATNTETTGVFKPKNIKYGKI